MFKEKGQMIVEFRFEVKNFKDEVQKGVSFGCEMERVKISLIKGLGRVFQYDAYTMEGKGDTDYFQMRVPIESTFGNAVDRFQTDDSVIFRAQKVPIRDQVSFIRPGVFR